MANHGDEKITEFSVPNNFIHIIDKDNEEGTYGKSTVSA